MRSSSAQEDARRRVLGVVERYVPFDASERAHRDTILRWLNGAQDFLNPGCFDPGHGTGSAFIVSKEANKVALAWHKRLRKWLQPGGHAEGGEWDLLRVALREAEEELGLRLDPEHACLFDLDVHEIAAAEYDPSHLHFDFRYLYEADYQPLSPASDAKEARWVSPADAQELGLDRGLSRMFEKCAAGGILKP